MTNEYIDQKILLNFNKISLKFKIYLINDFQSNFIIDMNVIDRNDIDFFINKNIFKIDDTKISFAYAFIDFIKVSYHYTIKSDFKK